MSSKSRRAVADRGKESGEDGVVVDRKMIETIKEATGATEEDIRVMLFECNYDANETTSRLIDNPFSQVQSKKDKKKKRDEDKKKEPAAKIVEIRRSSSQGGRSRGHDRERNSRGDRSFDRGSRSHNQSNLTPAAAPTEKQPLTSSEPPAAGGWDQLVANQLEPHSDLLPSSGGIGETSTTAPGSSSGAHPIAAPSQPAPIRPGSWTGAKSMADLFKQPQDPVGGSRQPQINTSIASVPEKIPEDSEPNGWGGLHSNDTDPLRQGSSLGGVAVSAPPKSQSSQPVQPGSVTTPGALPPQQPAASLPSASPGRQQTQLDEEVSAPSTTGLGGIAVEAPARQHNDSQQQMSWVPKAPAVNRLEQSTLGSSILSSLSGETSGAPNPLTGGDPLVPASQSNHQPEIRSGGQAYSSTYSPVILPPSAQQGGSDLGGLNFTFGNFGLGGTGQDLGNAFVSSGLAMGFDQSASGQLLEPHAATGVSLPEAYRSAYSQPQSSLAQSSISQLPTQPQQQQRAYNAFTSSGVQPQAAQRPATVAAPEAAAATSQALYSQGYPSYASNQPAFSQYQSPATSQHASQYQNYQFQGEPEQAAATSSAVPQQPQSQQQQQQQAVPAPPKRGGGYEGSGYGAYSQAPKEGQPSLSKYAAGGQTQSHVAGTGPSSMASAAAIAAQTPLTQMAGYGAGQMAVAGMSQQGYGYAGQQYGNYPQQYSNYSSHPGSNYGYGGQSGYQAGGGYNAGSSGYGQGAKYNRNYGATGGGYQQQQQHHAGGYGGQSHKQDKDHQAAHLGAHDLYGQQPQLPLGGGQPHYQAAGLRDHNYSYQNPGQGYVGYGTGRQYNHGYYGRDQ